jgi:nucleoside phosphorylase
MSHIRVVRFTDVDPEHLANRLSDIEGRSEPPEGVTATGVQFLHDEDQRTAVVIQHFASAEDMASSEEALAGMDPGDTPGTRASIDRCELKAELGN